MTISVTPAECSCDISAAVAPRRTLAEVIEIARDLALCAEGADAELDGITDHSLTDDRDWERMSNRMADAIDALVAEIADAHRAGQIDAILGVLRGHRARQLRQVAGGMIDLVGDRGITVARAAVQPHFAGEMSEAGIGDLDDLTLAALDTAINQALAGVA